MSAASSVAEREITVLSSLEDLVYEHLIDLVDFARLAELEQLVALHLHTLDAGRIYEPDSISDLADRASELIVRAWNRVLNDPRRYAEVRGSWLPDEDCPLCTLAGLSTPVDTDTSGVSSTVDT